MGKGLAIYVHWPFCLKKCPYCDFNSHVRPVISHDQWRNALLTELTHSAEYRPDAVITSIFFGGGTPSLMHPETVAAIIQAAKTHWPQSKNPEITLEANPTSVESKNFEAFKKAGVNRLSMGIQSLNDDALTYLGRQHSSAEALAALETANAIFGRTSFDLIYARPNQTPGQWQQELEQAIAYSRGHLSLYQLTIEPGTEFYRNNHQAMDADLQADLYHLTTNITQQHGFQAYEVSNYCQPGQASVHNLTYWQGGDYLGIGPGAHERIQSHDGWHAKHRIHNPERWMVSVDNLGHGIAKDQIIQPRGRAKEILMMSLRLQNGLSEQTLITQTGLNFTDMIDTGALNELIAHGFLTLADNTVSATPDGRLCLNAVLTKLLKA